MPEGNMSKSKSMGQVFTTKAVVNFMINLSTLKDRELLVPILEPSCGDGAFLRELEKRGFVNLTGYEIDSGIKQVCKTVPRNEDFLFSEDSSKYGVCIGNPPYIRRKNMDAQLVEIMDNFSKEVGYVNSLSDFSFPFFIRSIERLEEGGELLFITPSYWLTTKHGEKMREFMMANGCMRMVVKFNEANVFNGEASLDAIIFSYIKSKDTKEYPRIDVYEVKKGEYTEQRLNQIISLQTASQKPGSLHKFSSTTGIEKYDIGQFEQASNWAIHNEQSIVTNELSLSIGKIEECTLGRTLGDYVEIGNGIVTGMDAAFKIKDEAKFSEDELKATKNILKAKNIKKYTHGEFTKYIWLNESEFASDEDFQQKHPGFHEHLSRYREGGENVKPGKRCLEQRFTYNDDTNWWDWVYLRNMTWLSPARTKIFCPCKERFDSKGYVRFCLVKGDVLPLQDVTGMVPFKETQESPEFITAWLNSDYVYDWLVAKGHSRGGVLEFSEAPLMRIPFLKIDFESRKEKELHDEITLLFNNKTIDTNLLNQAFIKLLKLRS
jgi:adenine-specific DNA-methyltransferase